MDSVPTHPGYPGRAIKRVFLLLYNVYLVHHLNISSCCLCYLFMNFKFPPLSDNVHLVFLHFICKMLQVHKVICNNSEEM